MRLLVVSTCYPLPARNGLQVQLAGLLRELRTRHEVVLVCPVSHGDDLEAAPEVCARLVPVTPEQGRAHRVRVELATLLSRRPVLAAQVTGSALARAAARTAAEGGFDVVHLTPGWTAELAGALAPVPVVLAALDATAPNLQAQLATRTSALGRHLTRREGRRMQRFEATAYTACDAVVLVTEADAALLREAAPGLALHVVTNGVDADAWARPPGSVRDPGLVVLSGAMDYPPNVAAAVHAAHEVLPLLRQAVPTARLRLVGRDPSPEVLALAGEHVEVTGTVEQVRTHLWEAGAYLCPMTSGTGVKNKLLEALAAGCPSVVTPLATAGLGLVDGRDALVATSPHDLAGALARVLTDPALAARLSGAAVARASELSWGQTAAGFERVYAEAAARRR